MSERQRLADKLGMQHWDDELLAMFARQRIEELEREWHGCTHLDCLPECKFSLEDAHCERYARWQRENG